MKSNTGYEVVDKILGLCEERGIRVSALEKALGFSNGFIKNRTTESFPFEALIKIADYFGVPIWYFSQQLEECTKPYLEQYAKDKVCQFITRLVFETNMLS